LRVTLPVKKNDVELPRLSLGWLSDKPYAE
jgi:hypothetical protein